MSERSRRSFVAVAVTVVIAGCVPSPSVRDEVAGSSDPMILSTVVETLETPPPTDTSTPSLAPTATPNREPSIPELQRPAWLGTRPLELGPDGEALPADTPPELVERQLPTVDRLPRPKNDVFSAQIVEVPGDVLARSTWTETCPVRADELRYVTMTFWGFDDRSHTGEMLVHRDWAEEVTAIFHRLFDAQYPIEEMRIVSAEEMEGIPTGDGNVTSAFVCRPVRGATTWSQHAYGLAVDINPFLNPYRRGDRILPELAGSYLDREYVRPGMLFNDSLAVQEFDRLGWGWGGRWNSLVDYMHFSANGR